MCAGLELSSFPIRSGYYKLYDALAIPANHKALTGERTVIMHFLQWQAVLNTRYRSDHTPAYHIFYTLFVKAMLNLCYLIVCPAPMSYSKLQCTGRRTNTPLHNSIAQPNAFLSRMLLHWIKVDETPCRVVWVCVTIDLNQNRHRNAHSKSLL